MEHFFNNYKLVQFDDSRYGIRKGRIFYIFVDIKQPQFAWPQWHRYYLTDCRSSNLQDVILLYNKLQATGYKILNDEFISEANPEGSVDAPNEVSNG